MKMNQLPKLVEVPKKRLGRGHGSGKVKTSGRGTKGQKARGTVRHGFEGGQIALTHRLPFLRGKERNASQKEFVLGLPIARLGKFASGATVSVKTLKEKRLIHDDIRTVKLIGNTQLLVPLTIEGIRLSKGAKLAVEKAGGKVS
jgi:large subunit ribosomal protein L15